MGSSRGAVPFSPALSAEAEGTGDLEDADLALSTKGVIAGSGAKRCFWSPSQELSQSYSVFNQSGIYYAPPNRGRSNRGDNNSLYIHTTIYILAVSHTLSSLTSNERWCHYLHGAIEAERLNNLFQDVAERGPSQPCWLQCAALYEPGVLTN